MSDENTKLIAELSAALAALAARVAELEEHARQCEAHDVDAESREPVTPGSETAARRAPFTCALEA